MTDPHGAVGIPTQPEKEALNQVEVNSFTIVPRNVSPFGTVTATWDVTIPETAFDITLVLHNQPVAATGTKTFKLSTQSDSFALRAVINDPPLPFASRLLKTIQVVVNTGDCQTLEVPASAVTDPLKAELDAVFSSTGDFTLNDGGSVVTAGADGLVDIHVPLTISVPDWFDADMDIHIELTINGANGHVFVAAPVVDPQVSFSLLSNLLSFGCTDAIGAGMTKMASVFLERIVDEELRPRVEQKIVEQVNSFLGILQNSDPQQRAFFMSTLTLSAGRGLIITGCPVA
jgi:hypothetical protein